LQALPKGRPRRQDEGQGPLGVPRVRQPEAQGLLRQEPEQQGKCAQLTDAEAVPRLRRAQVRQQHRQAEVWHCQMPWLHQAVEGGDVEEEMHAQQLE